MSHIKEALALIETKKAPDWRRDAALAFGSVFWGVSATELLFQVEQHTPNVIAMVAVALVLVISTASITWGLFKK